MAAQHKMLGRILAKITCVDTRSGLITGLKYCVLEREVGVCSQLMSSSGTDAGYRVFLEGTIPLMRREGTS